MKPIIQWILTLTMFFSTTAVVKAEEPDTGETGEETVTEVTPAEEEGGEETTVPETVTGQEEETAEPEITGQQETPAPENTGEPEGEEPPAEETVEPSEGESPEPEVTPSEEEQNTEGTLTEETEPAEEEIPEEPAEEEETEPEETEEPEAVLTAGTSFSPEEDALTYEVLDESEKTVTVTGAESGLTSITIPAEVTFEGETYRVTEIAEKAFENYGTIQELIFAPESNLTVIHADAFAYSKKDGSVPATISVLTFPASLEEVEDGAFHCIPVEHFALEDGSNLKEIPCGFLAADGKDGHPGEETESEGFFDWLHQILFESPSFTPAELAKACDALKTVDFGDNNSLTLIGMGAFKNQTHLTSIDFGENPRAEKLIIANGVFVAAGNNGAAADRGEETLGGIDTLVFPANLSQIGEGIYNEGALGDSGSFNLARIKHLVFSDNSKLEVIPEGFMEVTGMNNNGYPGQAGRIDPGTGEYITDYTISYKYPKKFEYDFVKDPVQIAANSLETISFGANNSLTIIENGAFKNQNHLKSIDFGTSSAELIIDKGTFIGAGNNGYLVEQGIDKELNEGIVDLTFPANLAELRDGAFNYAKIIHLTFSDNCILKEIPSGFLGICGFGNNGYPGQAGKWVEEENKYTYDWDDDKSSFTFVKDLAQLESNSLESVSFGNNNSLASVGSGAFFNQSHLKVIDFGTSAAPSLSIGSGAFIGVGNNGYLYDQKIDNTLNEGIETLVLPSNLTHLERGVFEYAKIKNLVFSDNCKLETIPEHFMGLSGYGNNGYPGQGGTWNNDTNKYDHSFVKDSAQLEANRLESVYFGQNNSLTTIERGSFYNQSHLKVIDFGTSEKESLKIDYGSFIGVGNNGYLYDQKVDAELNRGIEKLVLPANLTHMDTGVFDYASIRNLELSDNSKLTAIPDNFLGVCGVGNNGHPGQDADGNFVKDSAQLAANVLETIKFGENNSLTAIGPSAFRNQSHVTEIDFGSSSAEHLTINSGAFIGAGNNSYLVENGADTELCAGIETLTIPANVKNTEVPVSNSLLFNNSRSASYYEDTQYGNAPFSSLQGNVYEYVFIDGYGTEDDWADIDLTGKVAICSRGGTSDHTFSRRANIVDAKGAAALIVYANSSQNITMNLSDYTGSNPAVFISQYYARNVKNESAPVRDDQGNILYYTGTVCVNHYTQYGLDRGAFGYAGIKNLEFEDGLEINALEPGAFQDLDLMKELVLGENSPLTEIGGGAFSKCDALKTIDLRDSHITNIDDAFKENPRLTSIIFPETLESITWSGLNNPDLADPTITCPFYGSDRLKELHFTNPDPDGLTFEPGVFQHLKKDGTVYVPDETTDEQLKAYQEKLAQAGLNWEVMRESGKASDSEDEEVVMLDRDYIILDQGDSLKLNVVEPEGFQTASVTWSVENDVNEPYAEGETPLITVEDDGTVTAGETEGTAYVLATITDQTGAEYYARTRVDVVTKDIREDLKQYGVRLIDTKVKVALLSTDYTPVRVQLTLKQNMNTFNAYGTGNNTEEPKEESKVQSAEFTNRAVSNIFDLKVYDDLTVEIIPKAEYVTTDAAVLKTVKGSYKSAITLMIDDKPYTSDQVLKISVNKKLPKVTVSAVTLNSFFDDGQYLKIKGGTVEDVTTTDAIPWLELDSDGAESMLWYKLGENNANWKLKKNAKMNLQVQLAGWAVPVNTKVTVKAAPTVPKLTFKSKTLKLNPRTFDVAATTYKITPAVFEDSDVYVSRIAEGKNISENTGHNLPFVYEGLQAGVLDGYLYVSTNDDFDGSKARTFKVYVSVEGIEYPVTVKTLKRGTAITMSVKASGNINLSIPGSKVTLTAATKNFRRESVYNGYEISRITAANDPEGPDLKDQFEIEAESYVITLKAGAGLQPGTYIATMQAPVSIWRNVEKTVKFTVVDKALAQSVTLKGKGKIDVLRPGTAVTLTPAFKNCFEYELSNVTITNKAKTDVTEKFNWEENEDGSIAVSIRDGAKVLHTDKYTVTATYKVNGTETTITSKPAKLTVTQGKSSAVIDKKKAEVHKLDSYSLAEVKITLTDDTVAGIDRITYVSPKAGGQEVFTMRELGNDTYAIAFNSNLLPANLKYKGGTVKIQVFMKGNETAKPNTTFNVKVTLK